jgi:hypothetical protein
VSDTSHILRVMDDIEREQDDRRARQVRLLSAAAYTPEPARPGVRARVKRRIARLLGVAGS